MVQSVVAPVAAGCLCRSPSHDHTVHLSSLTSFFVFGFLLADIAHQGVLRKPAAKEYNGNTGNEIIYLCYLFIFSEVVTYS